MPKAARALFLIGLLSLAGGCNVLGVIAYGASGGQKIPPDYKLPNRPTLIMVENYENPDLLAAPADRIERSLTDDLTEAKVAKFLAPEKVNELKASDPADFRKMNIPAVGRAIGAQQVIYVNLIQFNVEAPVGGSQFIGRAEADVKVIDCDTGRTLWPADSSIGHVVKLETRSVKDVNDARADQVENQLYEAFGLKLAKLFRESPAVDQTVDEAASR
jgi:hypothetical protein